MLSKILNVLLLLVVGALAINTVRLQHELNASMALATFDVNHWPGNVRTHRILGGN